MARALTADFDLTRGCRASRRSTSGDRSAARIRLLPVARQRVSRHRGRRFRAPGGWRRLCWIVPGTEPGGGIARSFVCRDRRKELAEFARAEAPHRAPRAGRTAIVPAAAARGIWRGRSSATRRCRNRRWTRCRWPRSRSPPRSISSSARSRPASPAARWSSCSDLRISRSAEGARSLGRTRSTATSWRRNLGDAAPARRARRGRCPAPRAALEPRPPPQAGCARRCTRRRRRTDRRHPGVHRLRERKPADGDEWIARSARAQRTVRRAAGESGAQPDPAPLSISELSGAVRRGSTARPSPGSARPASCCSTPARRPRRRRRIRIVGLCSRTGQAQRPEHLLSAVAARTLAGPAGRIASAARRAVQDLLRLPRRRVIAVVHARGRCDRVAVAAARRGGLRRAVDRTAGARTGGGPTRGFVHEALATIRGSGGRWRGGGWLALRSSRRFDQPRFRGRSIRAASTYAVSKLERYAVPVHTRRASSSCRKSATSRPG